MEGRCSLEGTCSSQLEGKLHVVHIHLGMNKAGPWAHVLEPGKVGIVEAGQGILFGQHDVEQSFGDC